VVNDRVLRAVKAAIGLLALVAMVIAAGSAAPRARSDPTRFRSVLAALRSDLRKVKRDLAGEERDIRYGRTNPAGACYNLFNNVHYDVNQRLDHDAGANALIDRNNLQGQIGVMEGEIRHLSRYEKDFGNNRVAPLGGHWAEEAIGAMRARMQHTTSSANQLIDQVNADVMRGYMRARLAWEANSCPPGDKLTTTPVHLRPLPPIPDAVWDA